MYAGGSPMKLAANDDHSVSDVATITMGGRSVKRGYLEIPSISMKRIQDPLQV